MSLSELLLILIVALVVFGPDKLPELAKTLGRLFLKMQRLKERFSHLLYEQKQQFQLHDNISKAEAAEKKHRASTSQSE